MTRRATVRSELTSFGEETKILNLGMIAPATSHHANVRMAQVRMYQASTNVLPTAMDTHRPLSRSYSTSRWHFGDCWYRRDLTGVPHPIGGGATDRAKLSGKLI